MKKLLILGLGYVGKALKEFEQSEFEVLSGSRSSQADIHFDLNSKDTWQNTPTVDFTIWTFPAEPLAQVKDFLQMHGSKLGQIIVIGTTGSISVEETHQIVDEESNFNENSERLKGEEFIRQSGGVLVHSAGIYGPDRDPRDWVMRGLVGPDDRYVNFIHVDDLCQFLLASCKEEHQGKRYIAADSNPKKWSELIEDWVQKYNLVLPGNRKASSRKSKRVDASQSIQDLGIELKYNSVNEGLWPIGS